MEIASAFHETDSAEVEKIFLPAPLLAALYCDLYEALIIKG